MRLFATPKPAYVPVMPPTVRFAPSPTGRLHLGNARTAAVNWLFARRHGGRLILRLDDTDRERSRPEHEVAIREDLRWLGLGWDAEARQSERDAVYAAALERLRAAGRAYPCYETPDELEARRAAQLARGQPPLYDRAALGPHDTERTRAEAAGRHPHWRFDLQNEPERLDDLVHGPVEIPLAGTLSDPVVRRETDRRPTSSPRSSTTSTSASPT
jgi:glutamyl-tRNA synthetase